MGTVYVVLTELGVECNWTYVLWFSSQSRLGQAMDGSEWLLCD